MSSKGYYVYLDKCLLPVSPQKIQITFPNHNKTVFLAEGQEINILKEKSLKEVELAFLIPHSKYPFMINPAEFRGAGYYADYLEKLKNSGKPFQFIVSRCLPAGNYLFSTNIKVTLESVVFTESGKEGFDTLAQVKLKQYADYGAKHIKVSFGDSAAHLENTRSDSSTQNKQVTIGCDVIVNGRLYGTSYGDAPGQTRTNYRGKINFINLKGSHPYHVTTPQGLWQGWVTKDSVRVI